MQKVQLCISCGDPTEKCEEDSLYLEPEYQDQSPLGPLCEQCYDERWNEVRVNKPR